MFIEKSAVYLLVSDVLCKRYNVKYSSNSGGVVVDPGFEFFRIPKRTSHGQFKYILQKEAKVLTVYPGMMTVFDILTTDQRMTPYRLMASDGLVSAAPLDFNNDFVLLVEYLDDRVNPVVKVVRLNDGSVLGLGELDGLDHSSLFSHLSSINGLNGLGSSSISSSSKNKLRIHIGKLYLDGLIIGFSRNHGKAEVVLYELPTGRVAVKFPRYWSRGVRILDIAVWAGVGGVQGVGILDDSGGVSLWRVETPDQPVRTGRCPEAAFGLDLPYRLQVLDDDRVLVTCDVGVVGVELGGKI